jgi:hypothetical protein
MVLWGTSNAASGVQPEHYRKLMNLVTHAKSFGDFLAETEKPASVWKKMNQLDSIHEDVLEKELKSLEKLAGASLKAIPSNLARIYQRGGLLPDPEFVENKFSAAIEFLRSSILLLRNGAKPRKNDRGLYIDQQLFFYLADPELTLVTKENFSNKVKASPQAARVLSYETFSTMEIEQTLDKVLGAVAERLWG